MQIKKILLVGDFGYSFYEPAFAKSLRKIGIEVIEYKTGYANFILSFIFKIESYLSVIGPISLLFYYRLQRVSSLLQPDVIFFWRPTQITPSIINSLKKCCPQALLVNYNNDNPFGKQYQLRNYRLRKLWSHFIKTIPAFDINIVYRNANVSDYNKVGSKKTILFPPAFIPDQIPDLQGIDFIYDVVFIGHAESKRIHYINFLISKSIKVKIFGTGWDLQQLNPAYSFGEIIPVRGMDYYQALRAARINLAFLSDLNEDVYTRRSFEIPGMGGLMLSERTPELESFFTEGSEAVFFSNPEELLEKVLNILANQELQQKIRQQAKEKSVLAGYDLDSRVSRLINDLTN